MSRTGRNHSRRRAAADRSGWHRCQDRGVPGFRFCRREAPARNLMGQRVECGRDRAGNGDRSGAPGGSGVRGPHRCAVVFLAPGEGWANASFGTSRSGEIGRGTRRQARASFGPVLIARIHLFGSNTRTDWAHADHLAMTRSCERLDSGNRQAG